MYKVFFKDRTVFFGDDFSTSFRNNSGLFYKFRETVELKELIDAFFKLNKISQLFIFHDDINLLKEKFTSCFELVKASGGLVKNNNHEFLMIMRNGIWDLPKGKNDPGETPEEAALREVSEECGLFKLSIKEEITKTYHTYILDNKPILKETTWFEMLSIDEHSPVPQESESITETSWMKSEDLAFVKKNTYPSIIEVLTANKII
jgi:8-oxo-dGTP pyrophosphatase MutT (NUDIX family)